MIKVLYAGMTDNMGGIENFIINYYRNINNKNITIDFINIYDNKLCFSDEIEKKSKIFNVPNYYKHPFRYIKEVKKILIKERYDIIHCNMNSAVMLYPLIAAKLAKTPIIISHSHNSSSDKGVIKNVLHSINKNFIPLLANEFWACSKTAGEWFYSKKILAGKHFKVVNNAIDMKKFTYDANIRNSKRNELGILNSEKVVGHVGRFNKQKNHEFLIKVFNEYLKVDKNLKLVLVGSGPLENNIKNMINELKLEDKVIFLGGRTDVNELYCAFDYFVMPSLYEGLPLVGVEAQATGLPCVFSSNITDEIMITQNAYKLSLRDSLDIWVDTIKNIKISDRKSMIIHEFDIGTCSKDLEIKYESLVRDFYDKKFNNSK